MAKIPTYEKDPKSGGIIFTDANAYVQRKKVIASHKIAEQVGKDSKRSINSMKREIKDLKKKLAASESLENRIRMLEQGSSESSPTPSEEGN
jgi:hypothetical protein